MTNTSETLRDAAAALRLMGGIVKIAVMDARTDADAASWLDDLCSCTGGDWRQAAQRHERRYRKGQGGATKGATLL
jgi:hypothetical protein